MARAVGKNLGLAIALGMAMTASLASPFDNASRATAAELDALRGGFTTVEGLQVSLGLERLVTVNGETVSLQSLQLADVGAQHGRQLGAVQQALSGVKLVQNGEANVMLAPLSVQASGAMVIQNSLNDQRIQTSTVINAAVNSADLIKSLNFQGSLGDALARTATSR